MPGTAAVYATHDVDAVPVPHLVAHVLRGLHQFLVDGLPCACSLVDLCDVLRAHGVPPLGPTDSGRPRCRGRGSHGSESCAQQSAPGMHQGCPLKKKTPA